MLRDAFEDAVLMGVDEAAMRRILAELVAALPSPKRPRHEARLGRGAARCRRGAGPAAQDWVPKRVAELQALDKVTARITVLAPRSASRRASAR